MAQVMKLSKKQLDILQKVNSARELGHIVLGSIFGGGWWMQKGGLEHGGEVIHKHLNTSCYILLKKGLIQKRKQSFPTSSYKLTELGKEQVNDSANSTGTEE